MAIALLGVLDPTVTTRRFARAEVQLLATVPGRDSALVASVARRLGKEFRVIVGDAASADATVLVGDRLPQGVRTLRGPVVAVVPPRPPAWVAFERVDAPASALRDERITVTALVHTVGLKDRRLEVVLRDGARVVARKSVTPSSTDERLPVSLPFVTSSAGAARLHLTAEGVGGEAAAADALVDVLESHHDILAFDLRPSWQATFVRRALETDRRLTVTSRVVTSRGVSTARGAAPTGLSDPALLGRYRVVVVGAPGMLTERDVSALARFLRERGGRVVLLLEEAPAGALMRLVGGSAWRHDSSGRVVEVAGDSTLGRLRGASLLLPSRLPAGAEVIAQAGAGRPVIWKLPVGDGELVVVGVVDAWQRRAAAESDFIHFWPTLVAGLAASVPPPIELSLEHSVLGTRDSTIVRVTLNDVAGGRSTAAAVTASLVDSSGHRSLVRLWPGPAIGSLVGTVQTRRTGPARVEVRRGTDTASAPLRVDSAGELPRPAEQDLQATWVAGSGGVVVPGDNLARLPDVVHQLIGVPPAPEPWHPMRSPWWILPFACLLATEWWLRRRAGDA